MSEPCPNCGVRGDVGCKHRPAEGNTPIAYAEPKPRRLGEGLHHGGGRYNIKRPKQ